MMARDGDAVRQFLPRSQGGLAPRDSPTHPVCVMPSGARSHNPCPAGTTGPLTSAQIDTITRQAREVQALIAYIFRPRSVEEHVREAAREFGIPEDAFVRVIRCESQMNPQAVNRSSGALGLGQHLPRYYAARAANLGYGYGSWSDPRANARVSAWLWRTSGPQHWVCY